MHHWGTIHDCAVAPSPIVPTYRPDPPMNRRYSSMPSTMSAAAAADISRARGSSAPKPQARSAGMAERPGRNESLSDLVQFLQTQSMPASAAESTTALPSLQSPFKEPLIKEQSKPLHRRLWQFAQRQKKDASTAPKSKADEQRRQIEALQREGYLLSGSKTVSSLRSTRSKASIDSSLTRSKKKDVENIGQPWLEKSARADNPKVPADAKGRLASLDLGDFSSMVDVAASMATDFDDSSPPPYQASASIVSRSGKNLAPQSSSTLSLARATEARPSESIERPTSPLVDSRDEHAPSPSSGDSSIRIVGRGATLASQPATQTAILHANDSANLSGNSEAQQEASTEHPGRAASNPSGTTSKPLKLFPDVAPPRGSSKEVRRLSAVPRYQKPLSKPLAASSDIEMNALGAAKPAPNAEPPSDKSSSGDLKTTEQTCSGALPTPSDPTESSPAGVESPENAAQGRDSPRTSPFAIGTLKAFPLPAPTRPLPSTPRGHAPLGIPQAKPQSTVRVVRSRPMDLTLPLPQPSPIAEDPRELQGRPVTALGYAGEQDAADDHDSLQSRTSLERPKSTEPGQHSPRRRAPSIRVPRMHDLHESPTECSAGLTTEGRPIADSPVLGPVSPTKRYGKRASRKGLQINSKVDRDHLPFGLPSPPPTAALPSDPPTQPATEHLTGHRNYSAPNGLATVRGLDIAFQGCPKASTIFRSNSSRSSLRHESIPESYERNRCESPLPSSDDEGFGPSADTLRPRSTVERQSYRTIPFRRGYEVVDARTGQCRPRHPHSARPMTPHGHGSQATETTCSPQSQYSQSTYRSMDSKGSYRAQPGSNGVPNFLEDRVANLERQNQILQAALLAALNAGAKSSLDNIPDSNMSPTFPTGGLGNSYPKRYTSRPESWVSSSRSSEQSGCDTPASIRESRAKVRQLDNMIEDIESGWLSDRSSHNSTRLARNR